MQGPERSVLSALPRDASFWTRAVTAIPGIGPVRAERLAVLGIQTWGDLLLHLPRRYQVFHFCPTFEAVDALDDGAGVLMPGEVVAANVRRSWQRPHLVIESVIFSVGPRRFPIHLLRPVRGRRMPPPSVKPGTRVHLRAVLRWRDGVPHFDQPEFVVHNSSVADRVIPVYPLTQGISQKLLRESIHHVLMQATTEISGAAAAADVLHALRLLHQPQTPEDPERGRRSLALLEIALLPAPTPKLPSNVQAPASSSGSPRRPLCEAFLRHLPFEPTGAQRRAMAEWDAEVEQPIGTQRLLTGDVGSGKTLVIAYALLKAVELGGQGALIAPTRLLAEQHANSLRSLLRGLDVRLELLTSLCSADERSRILTDLQNGTIDIIVGTQALLQEGVRFRRLGLGVIDEQHRFGVAQRDALAAKGAERMLIVSATPIPRTLAETVYRGLPVSRLDEKPPGRRPVETLWVPTRRRAEVVDFLRRRTAAGEQAFVVCPYIDSDDHDGGLGAEEMYRHLQQELGKDQVALIHGRMSAERQATAMEAFAAGRVPILVATSIIEVGVDVPHATIMVIEAAHLFGLAQLHQLRGRVGRGDRQAYAILISDGPTAASRERLAAIRRSSDGFYLAEQDLKLRGPGEFIGMRQWGLTDLQFVDLARDIDLFTLVNSWRDKNDEKLAALIDSIPVEWKERLIRRRLHEVTDE